MRPDQMMDDETPEIVVLPDAEADISEAFRWYEDKNEGMFDCDLIAVSGQERAA